MKKTDLDSFFALQSSFGLYKTLIDNIAPVTQFTRYITEPALLDYQRTMRPWLAQIDAVRPVLNQYNSLIDPICQMQKIWDIPTWINQNSALLQQQLSLIQDIPSLTPLLREVKIHENFVSVPEELIPDDFQCEEVTHTQDNAVTKKTAVKHLSFANAIALLSIIIPFLCWLISCIREDISSRQEQLRHNELIAVQKEANRLKEEELQLRQKQLDLTEEYTANLFAIYQQLQESDSAPPETDSCPRCDRLRSEPAEVQNPTEADDSEYFESESDRSEQR